MIGKGFLKINSSPKFDKIMIFFWLLGPFFYLIERDPADLWLTTISLTFFIASILGGDTWVSNNDSGHLFFRETIMFRIPTLRKVAVDSCHFFRSPSFMALLHFWKADNISSSSNLSCASVAFELMAKKMTVISVRDRTFKK